MIGLLHNDACWNASRPTFERSCLGKFGPSDVVLLRIGIMIHRKHGESYGRGKDLLGRTARWARFSQVRDVGFDAADRSNSTSVPAEYWEDVNTVEPGSAANKIEKPRVPQSFENSGCLL